MAGHWQILGGYPNGPKIPKRKGQMSPFADDGKSSKKWKKQMRMEMKEILDRLLPAIDQIKYR